MNGAGASSRATARLLRAATVVLRGAGIESPRLDAEVLLAAAAGTTRFDLIVRAPDVDAPARRRFARMIRARASHEPVSHLVGFREFRSLALKVDRRVLTPRPETEILADAAIAWLRARRLPQPRVLDLGCGSGCLAIAIALAIPEAAVVGVDVSPDALAVARENVEDLASGRVTLALGDLFSAVANERPFDLVVSNPPYVGAGEIAEVDRSVREFEPEDAWLAGDDPICFHKRILLEGKERMAALSATMMELGSGLDDLLAFARAAEPRARIDFLPDLAGRPRVVVVERAG